MNNQTNNRPRANPILKGSKPPEKKKNVNSTQSALPFSEIHDGIVVMRDGSLRCIIMASPLNYDLKSREERDAIEYAYQAFLNGLHFPIQIVVRSRKIDLTEYLEKLENLRSNQENQLLADLMEDYIYNIRGLVQDANIMRKEFFVVVPMYLDQEDKLSKKGFFSELGKVWGAKKQTVQTPQQFFENCRDLRQRTAFVAQGLAQIGMRCVRLKTQEIIELFYSCYNLEESMYQALIPTGEIIEPSVVTRQKKLDPSHYTRTVIQDTAVNPNLPAMEQQLNSNQPHSIIDIVNAQKAAAQPQTRSGLVQNYTNVQPGQFPGQTVQPENLSAGIYRKVS